jgi:DNA-binding PadR family transcriptional regulator
MIIRALRTIFLDALNWHAYNVDIVAELLGAFEQAVLLAVWRLVDEAYGRSILRGVQSALDRQIAAGAVYATLDRLEQKKLVDSRLEEGTAVRAGRARRYYRLTSRGIDALNESKSTLEHLWRGAKWPLGSRA